MTKNTINFRLFFETPLKHLAINKRSSQMMQLHEDKGNGIRNNNSRILKTELPKET